MSCQLSKINLSCRCNDTVRDLSVYVEVRG